MKKSLLLFGICICIVTNALTQFSGFDLIKSYNDFIDMDVSDNSAWLLTTEGVVERRIVDGEICAIYNSSNSILPDDAIFIWIKVAPDNRPW